MWQSSWWWVVIRWVPMWYWYAMERPVLCQYYVHHQYHHLFEYANTVMRVTLCECFSQVRPMLSFNTNSNSWRYSSLRSQALPYARWCKHAMNWHSGWIPFFLCNLFWMNGSHHWIHSKHLLKFFSLLHALPGHNPPQGSFSSLSTSLSFNSTIVAATAPATEALR